MAYLIASALDPASDTEATLGEKKTALAGIMQEAALIHDSTFTTVTYYDESVYSKAANTRQQRLAIMGSPERHIVVTPRQPLEGEEYDGRPGMNFDVFVYYGQGAASAATADAAFDALMGAVSSTVPGLMYAIQRQREFISATNHALWLTLVSTPVYGRYELDKSQDDYWWLAHLIINVA